MHNTYHTKLEKRQKIAVPLKNRKIYSIALSVIWNNNPQNKYLLPLGSKAYILCNYLSLKLPNNDRPAIKRC